MSREIANFDIFECELVSLNHLVKANLLFEYLGQSIQEWTKRDLWTNFKKFEVIWSA